MASMLLRSGTSSARSKVMPVIPGAQPMRASPESITTTGKYGFRACGKWRIHDVFLHLHIGEMDESSMRALALLTNAVV